MKQLMRAVGDYHGRWTAAIMAKLDDRGMLPVDDDGAVSTETAIVVGFLAAAAAAAGVIIIAKASSNASNIPDSVNP